MDILSEILEWSSSRPAWQRDALRRLVTHGALEDSDMDELTALCKAAHGLAEKRTSVPLGKQHIPAGGEGLEAARLVAVTHHDGVNALAKGQTLEFGSALTIVYGANAAGKSGYTRILKRACRARGAEDQVLGNVLAASSPQRPSASIRFPVEGKEHTFVWSDQEETEDFLGRVSIFDRHCAAVYLKERTDVAFRPFGLDLFDRLARACEAVRKTLEKEQRELQTLPPDLPELPEGTAAQEALSSITSLTDAEAITTLGTLVEAEREQLLKLHKRLNDLEQVDPEKTARTLNLSAQRFEALHSHLTQLTAILADNSVASALAAKDSLLEARRANDQLQATTFPTGIMEGTGSELWRSLWETARRFSTEAVYPDDVFPVTGKGARCVLCQQELDDAATQRLAVLESFVQSAIQQQLDQAIVTFEERRDRIASLVIADDVAHDTLEEIRIDRAELATSIHDALESARKRKEQILKALEEGRSGADRLPKYEYDLAPLAKETQLLRERASAVLRDRDQETRKALEKQHQELQAREDLGKAIGAVLAEIERQKKLAAYHVCLQDTNTHSITRKSTEVTQKAVTEQLTCAFQEEMLRLGFSHVEVELEAAGGERGALYHRLVLKRAPGIDLPRILSEGEACSLSLAAFLAELSTASDRSAIIFDDPVSSLDHEWRERVARRLVEEAQGRQVIVFTHDIVFLIELDRLAEQLAVSCEYQCIRREAEGTGVSSQEIPWVAMRTRRRIGALKSMWQQAEERFRSEGHHAYEHDAIHIYGLLRETWERAVEEVLLEGVVERYRHSVETQRAKHLSDITDSDCNTLEAAMTKCSQWLPGHDQAPAENLPVPDPRELKQDIDALETWVQSIRKRRD